MQESFIASTRQTQSWEEVFLSMDGIVVSGGNTLNQQAIWKAQGIDVVLAEAWDRGIVLGGASAGSLCWFEEGTTDSRPEGADDRASASASSRAATRRTTIAEPGRRPLYQKLIGSGQMKPGYACDNDAGIYFEDNEVKRVVSTRAGAKVYYVSVVNGTDQRTGDGARAHRVSKTKRWSTPTVDVLLFQRLTLLHRPLQRILRRAAHDQHLQLDCGALSRWERRLRVDVLTRQLRITPHIARGARR